MFTTMDGSPKSSTWLMQMMALEYIFIGFAVSLSFWFNVIMLLAKKWLGLSAELLSLVKLNLFIV